MKDYISVRDEKMRLHLGKIILDLPPFACRYFGGANLAWWTKRNYALELRNFFAWLLSQKEFAGIKIKEFSMANFNSVTGAQIELYMSNARLNDNSICTYINRIVPIRAFFKYFHVRGDLVKNVSLHVDIPKRPNKPIIALNCDEVQKLFAVQPEICKKFVRRNRVILLFLVSTGLRVSELVGLNTADVDLEHGQFVVVRKGGDKEVLAMNNMLCAAMVNYLSERNLLVNQPVFIGNKKCRITCHCVEQIVKQYVNAAKLVKRITPHKLRSTFGTNLYEKTGDIFLVSHCLGHRSIETTKKHYVNLNEKIVCKSMSEFNLVSCF